MQTHKHLQTSAQKQTKCTPAWGRRTPSLVRVKLNFVALVQFYTLQHKFDVSRHLVKQVYLCSYHSSLP